MTAYWAALCLSLAGAPWLIPGARSHVLALAAWTALSFALDWLSSPEMKLFADFFGAGFITILTLRDVVAGKYWAGKKFCAYLCLSSTAMSSLAYGFSKVFGVFHLSYEVFYMLMWTHGWVLNVLFLSAVLVLFWGSDGLARLRDRMGGLVRFLGRYSRVSPAEETYAASADAGIQLGTGVFQAGCVVSVPTNSGVGND